MNEDTLTGSTRPMLAAADPKADLLEATDAAAGFEEEELLGPHAIKTMPDATQAAAARIPTCLTQRFIIGMLPNTKVTHLVALKNYDGENADALPGCNMAIIIMPVTFHHSLAQTPSDK